MTITWVDKENTEIPERVLWPTLDDIELIRIKNILVNRMFMAGSSQLYLIPLKNGVSEIESILTNRLNKQTGS